MLTCNGMAKDSKTHNSKYMSSPLQVRILMEGTHGEGGEKTMKYDFTIVMDRHGKDAIAVDSLGKEGVPGAPKEGFDAIPMWVADMNFATVPTVQQEMIERASHPAFGYFEPREEYFSSIIKWQETRNGAKGLEKKHIGYENGVLGGLISVVSAFSAPGDAILLHSPTYIGFTRCIENSGRKIILSPLKKGGWTMRTWRRRFRRIGFIWQFSAIRIIRVVVCGRKMRLRRRWKCTSAIPAS